MDMAYITEKRDLGNLVFEHDDISVDLVDANRLGVLLQECGVPLMVLNACQSAQGDQSSPFSSVATRLLQAGIGGVLSMSHSVLVVTASRFIAEFYKALVNGQSIARSTDIARRELIYDTRRISLDKLSKSDFLELNDWFLPVLYQQHGDAVPFQSLDMITFPVEAIEEKKDINKYAQFPPSPIHGFHGRARELLDLERAFATHHIVVLNGFGGQGKTSLATQAAEWFTRTGLFERAVFISFEQGIKPEVAIDNLGNALVQNNFQIFDGDKVEAIAKSLKDIPTLVVWDNFESVLPKGNAPLSDDELQKLLDAGAKWAVNGSCLLVTTRNPEIPHVFFTPGINCLSKELTGLAPSDALDLASAIFEAHSIKRPSRVPLEGLLFFLKGHPLSLQLALAQLRKYKAEELLEQYQKILPSIQVGKGEERNESLEVSLRFSLDRLGVDALNWLSRLWIFEGGTLEPILLSITEIPEETWNALKPQLTSTALIRIEEISGISVPFIHFHPTLAPYLKAINDNSTAESQISNIEERYWNIYYQFANQLYDDDTQHPFEARSIVLRELPNLKRALKLTLAAGALDEAVTFAKFINMFLNVFGRWREMDEIAKEVEKHTSTQVNTSGKITKREYLMESGRGERLLQQGHAGEAEQVFRALLSRLEGDADYDTRYDQAMILGYLGRCLGAQGRLSIAMDSHRRAIVLEETLAQTENIRRDIAANHKDIADLLTNMGQYANAKTESEMALKFMREIHDDRSESAILGQLGNLAMRQGNLNEARKRNLEVLSLFQRMGEDQSEAIIWHMLGRVAEEALDWDEAERCHKQGLAISESLGDWALAAKFCNQLGKVAYSTGRFDECEKWARRALEIQEKSGNSILIAIGNHALAVSLLSLGRFNDAAFYIETAIKLYETVQDFENTVKGYSTAAQIAEKRGHINEAREWRRKEQESFAAFAGSDNEIKQFEPLIAAIVKAANGDEEAKAYLEREYQKIQGADEWEKGAQAFQRLVAGERNFELLAEGLGRTQALIIRRILQALSGGDGQQVAKDSQPSAANDRPQQEQGVTLPQLLELVERAATGDKELGGQLFTAFQQMARDDIPAMSVMGNVLLRVLVGERNPNLDGLPDEVASAIRGMLGRLKNK